MKISIITATFNSEKSLIKTLSSISSQTYQGVEHLFIDNCSTDNTVKLIKIYQLENPSIATTLISEKDRGISDAFNKGIKNATGDVIIILNSDDYFLSNSVLQDVANIFTQNKEIMMVHGKMIFEDEKLGTNERRPLLCHPKITMPVNHPTTFLRRDVYERIGVFKLKYKYAMDYDLICRYSKKFSITKNSYYFNAYPITQMSAGGISYTHEMKSMKECRVILQENNLFDQISKLFYYTRFFRLKTKEILLKFNLQLPITIWRNFKWKKSKI